MPQRDLHHNIKIVAAIGAQAISSDKTVDGAIIDSDGFDSVEYPLVAGALSDGTYTPSITVGDDSALADGATAGAADLLGTIADATFTATGGVKASIDLATKTTHINTKIRSKKPGTPGNSITIAFAGGSSQNAGVLSRIDNAFTFTFKTTVTLVSDFEAAVAALTGADALIEVQTAGTAGNAFVSAGNADVFTATALAGGADSALSNTAKKIGYRGTKRYSRLSITSTGTIAGGTIGAVAALGHPSQLPVT